MKRLLPPQALVHEMLDYDESSGVLRWKHHRYQTVQSAAKHVGREAGSIYNGYRFIKIHGFFQIGAHRLAWIYVNGEIPQGMEVDHIDQDRLNNAIANLRLATPSQNTRNVGPRSHNRLGVRGVTLTRFGTYYARLSVNGRVVNLGYYKTLEEAVAARISGGLLYHRQFCGRVL